jgi:hypothetical protein
MASTSNPTSDYFDTTGPTPDERRGADRRAILAHMEAAAAVPELQQGGDKPFKVTLNDGTIVERR